eukprot:702050-Prorocentrum_minimum.AAC.5
MASSTPPFSSDSTAAARVPRAARRVSAVGWSCGGGRRPQPRERLSRRREGNAAASQPLATLAAAVHEVDVLEIAFRLERHGLFERVLPDSAGEPRLPVVRLRLCRTRRVRLRCFSVRRAGTNHGR